MPQTKQQKRKNALSKEIALLLNALVFPNLYGEEYVRTHLATANNLRNKLGMSGWATITQFREWAENE